MQGGKQNARLIVALLVLLLLVRLAAMAGLPLMDTTEARYGEIARKMAEYGDWVTPWHDVGVPFWAKPPLSFWLTAISFKIFGVSEFTARLPHLLCGLAMAGLVWDFARRRFGRREALLSVSLLAGAALFFVASGAVMTDAALVLCLTLAMHAFWMALHAGTAAARLRSGGLFFAALGLGLLAKGPLIIVLVVLPLGPWLILSRRWREAWRSLPWLGGLLLAAAIAVPWYVLAEVRTPGFLDYFLIGEHWHRFVTPGWGGDLYGKAHRYAPGTIWLFALTALLPWTVIVPLAGLFGRRAGLAPARPEMLYLLLWALMPLLFFTAARNIIWPYVLPAMPALALLAGAWLARRNLQAEAWVAGGLVVLVIASAAGAVDGLCSGRIAGATARELVRACGSAQPLIFIGERPFSASFYSQGRAGVLPDVAALRAQLGSAGACVALPAHELPQLTAQGFHVEAPPGRFGDELLVRVRP